MLAYSQIVQSDRTFLFISLVFKIINSKFYNILIYYSNRGKYFAHIKWFHNKLTLKEVCENHLSQFFVQKSQKFYDDKIMVFISKMIEGDRTKHIWFNKLHLKYEKNLFRFCIKMRRNFFLNTIYNVYYYT